MYAVIKTGGKQYRVTPDEVIEIERLPGEAGDSIEFSQVLMVAADGGVEIGTPLVAGATVVGEIVEQTRGPKIIVFKKKRRKHYRRRNGHRQDLSEVRITEILTGGAKPAKKAAAKPKAKAEETPPPVSAAVTAAPAEVEAAEAAPRPKAAKPKAEKAQASDLTQISGIGPAMAKKLEGVGLTSVQQIADLTPEQAAEVSEQLKLKGRIEREEWIEQAKDLVVGKPPRAKADKND
jgi:large subunit ribosomal protein L21